MQENSEVTDFERIWCKWCERVDFTQPKLVPWEEIFKGICSTHPVPKLMLKALEPLCAYLVCEPENIFPLDEKGRKVSLVLKKAKTHPNPADFISGYFDIVQSNLGMDEELNKAVGAIFKDHPKPKAFAQAVKWLANTKLLNLDNLAKVEPFVSLWFGTEALNQYYRKKVYHAFTQDELQHFLEVSEVLSARILVFHLACRLCQLGHPIPRLKTALARLEMHFRENTFFLNHLSLFLKLPKLLSKSKFPDKVVIYLMNFLDADIFLSKNPNMASNLQQLIEHAILWFDPPELQDQWALLDPKKLSQEVLDQLVCLSQDLNTNEAIKFSIIEYLNDLSGMSTNISAPCLSDSLPLTLNIFSFYQRPAIFLLCPQIQNSIQADERKALKKETQEEKAQGFRPNF